MKQWIGWLLGLALLPAAVQAAAEQWPVSETQLDNGLTVLVLEDHRAPVVVSQLWYAVGSSYEHRGITGVSHVLEHMMFKGTEKYAPGEFSRIIASNGGEQNAFTGRDFTAYYEQLAADRLELALKLEADRMVNLRLDPAEFDKERQVVIEERRLRVEDKPVSRMYERFSAVAYPASPYGHPIIGWRSDLEALTLPDLQRWYERYYAPNNATLVVVGDVKPDEVVALARKHFGDIPASEVPPVRGTSDIDAAGERRIRVTDDRADVPYLTMGYEVPTGATADNREDVYALMVLAAVLDGGDGARLAQELVRDQGVAASVGAGYDAVARLDNRFSLSGAPTPDAGVAGLEAALREQVARLREETVAAEALERARNQLLADHLFSLDSMFYQAMQIGMLETTGIGWEALQDYEAGVRAVTPADIQRVARTYLTEQRLTVGVLDPGGDGSDTNKGDSE